MMFEEGFRELLEEFLLEAQERAGEVESLFLEIDTADAEERLAALAQVKRELHTLKGNSGMMGFGDLQQLAHQMEDGVEEIDLENPQIDTLLSQLDTMRRRLQQIASSGFGEDETYDAETPAVGEGDDVVATDMARDAGSVRVSFARIDRLVELQAEALIFRNRLADAVGRGKVLAVSAGEIGTAEELAERWAETWEDIESAQQSLEKTLRSLQEQITDLGMVPLQSLFRSLRRLVHDESAREGKQIEIEISGGETPIDKTLLEAAGDALGHLVRNAVIHGIEAPEGRRAAGKNEAGAIRLAATLDANEVWMEVADDGAGIDLAGLRRKAEQLHGPTHELGSDFALLFEEGVSTREGTDLSSGRGVGLSAVKRSVESHGGRIDVESERGRGTAFTLRLPVTASIMRSILVQVDGEHYALALTAVNETVRANEKDQNEINGAPVLRWRRRLVPVLDLGRLFGTAVGKRDGGFLVLIEVSGRFRALGVDDIVGIRDIVVKGLDSIVGRPQGISGSTILGDGRVVMILDPAALAAKSPFADA